MPTLKKVKVNTCERIYMPSPPSSSENRNKPVKRFRRTNIVKNSKDKSSSAGVITYIKPPVAKPKKTTKSDQCFSEKLGDKVVFDYCKNCGDKLDIAFKPKVTGTVDKDKEKSLDFEDYIKVKTDYGKVVDSTALSRKNSKVRANTSSERIQISSKVITEDQIPSCSKTIKNAINKDKEKKPKSAKDKDPIEQYYRNEKFHTVSDSLLDMKGLKKAFSLDTIKEVPEASTADILSKLDSSCIFRVYSDSDEEFADADKYDSLDQLRDFRDDNYFETHSVKSRMQSKGSVTSLPDHKCVYRFYLNDRLFPEPLCTDTNKEIRCTECHLPLRVDNKNKRDKEDINGTIQAKVKIGSGDETQDMILMLPVKEHLIVRQKRKVKPKKNEEIMYFGIIKLDSYGNSAFNKIRPADSMALKYQKGYREFEISDDIKYEKVDECDVIVI